MADETAVELTSCVLHLREVFVFIPPKRTTAASWAAASFGIDKPLFTGELKIMTHDEECQVRLYKKPEAKAAKGKEGELVFFAGCPLVIDYGDGVAAAAASGTNARKPLPPLQQLDQIVEPVCDSSRYFVLRVEDEKTKRRAFIAFGVADRADAFSFKSALQDHVRFVARQRGADARRAAEDALEEAAAAGDARAEAALAAARGKMRDLTLKEGETIKIAIAGGKKKKKRPVPAEGRGGSLGLLAPPPPPGGLLAPPPKPPAVAAVAPAADDDDDAAAAAAAPAAPAAEPATAAAAVADDDDDDWGDFQ